MQSVDRGNISEALEDETASGKVERACSWLADALHELQGIPQIDRMEIALNGNPDTGLLWQRDDDSTTTERKSEGNGPEHGQSET